MSGLDRSEAARLARFIDRLLGPVCSHASEGIARACLAARYPWRRSDLLFLRAMVCCRAPSADDYARLNALVARSAGAVGMNGRDLEAEMNSAADAVCLDHIRRIEALGVPLKAIAELGAELPPFGVQRVRWLSGALYEPDPDGEPAVIVPVPAAERQLGELGLVDLLAFSTGAPTQWAWRTGSGWLLGEWLLDEDEVVVVQSPIGWLAHAGRAACVLNWDAAPACWSALRQVPVLRFENETLKARAERAMRRAVTLPHLEVIHDAA